MNSMKNLLFLALFGLVLRFGSCSGNGGSSSGTEPKSSTESMEAADKNGPEYTSAYICPMHCKGSGSAEAGQCPVCKMDYVVNEDHQNHDDHEGHNH
jgi:hypothetical protein